jgi:choline dehydrogenase-like flavoprotein
MNSTNTSLSLAPEDAQGLLWDVVVVGTGIGGSTLGYALARHGFSVLFLERGKILFADPTVVRGAALANQLNADARMRHGWWPTPFCNMAQEVPQSFFHPVGCGTGGSSTVFSMVMERFRPQDFEPRQLFPGASESTVPDAWPIQYEDLSAHYAEAEQLYRVRGTPDPLFQDGHLMHPPDATPRELAYLQQLSECGLHPYRFHYACEHVPECEGCTAILCSRDCRNDAEKNCLRPALELHGAHILSDCAVTRLTAAGRAVRTATCAYQGKEIDVRGRIFVLAANAYLTPRLLFRSAGYDHPNGLANSSGLVGRNLMLHASDLVVVQSIRPMETAAMSHGIGINDYYIVDGQKLGSLHAHPLEIACVFPHSGRGPRAVLPFASIVEDLPYLHNRVLPPTGTSDDPAYAYTVPDELRRRCRMLVDRFCRDLRPRFEIETRLASGEVASLNLSHPCGTCRFGDDPRNSVLDRDNRAHDLDNLYIVDASFFPSSGGVAPSLTIAANAFRVAERIGQRL